MTYWTIMIITVLNGPMKDSQMYLLYPSEQNCLDAVVAVTDTLTYDWNVKCKVSETPSGSIHPKAKP